MKSIVPIVLLLLSLATATAQQPASADTSLFRRIDVSPDKIGSKVPLQTWPELAAHAGLVGIGPKSSKEFKVDVAYEPVSSINIVRAQITLTDAEWDYLASSTTPNILDFRTHDVGYYTWKATVEFIYGDEDEKPNVDPSKLTGDDPAAVIHTEEPWGAGHDDAPPRSTIRLYMLHADKDGGHKELFYFFNYLSETPTEYKPILQTWPELAAHAGLAGVSSKTEKEFKVDVVQASPGRASLVRAEVSLTDAEWDYLNNDYHHLLRFKRFTVDPLTWKTVVDAVYPFKTKVKTNDIDHDDTAAILRGENPWSGRVYYLHADKDGAHKKLFYFFNAIAPGRHQLQNPPQK